MSSPVPVAAITVALAPTVGTFLFLFSFYFSLPSPHTHTHTQFRTINRTQWSDKESFKSSKIQKQTHVSFWQPPSTVRACARMFCMSHKTIDRPPTGHQATTPPPTKRKKPKWINVLIQTQRRLPLGSRRRLQTIVYSNNRKNIRLSVVSVCVCIVHLHAFWFVNIRQFRHR